MNPANVRFASRTCGAYSVTIAAFLIGAAAVSTAALAQNSFGEATRPSGPQTQPAAQSPPATPPQQPGGGAGAQPQIPPGGFRPNAPGGAPQGGASGSDLDRSMQVERQDFGVAPTAQLHAGEMHGPTPASIPGGQVITTKGLIELLRGGQVPVLTLDVLGGAEMIQGAVYAVPAAQSGSFDDPTQQQLGQFLSQATGGNKAHVIVLYCLSPQCWMSYNAALRAINLGYTNVLWYRGGIEAWKQAGLPMQASGAR